MLLLGAVFVAAVACGVAIMAVACIKPEGSDAIETVDAHESHPFEAPAH